MNRCKS